MENTAIKYLVIVVALIFIDLFFQKLLFFDQLIYNAFSDRLSMQQIDVFLNFQKKWHWLSYISIFLLVLVKTIIIATTINVGLIFFDENFKFKTLWNIVLNAEFIFLLVPILKIIWFYFFKTNYDLEDLQNFYPLSVLNIIGYKGLDVWFVYPFQVLNLFEVLYVIFLAFQIGKITETNTDYGLKIVSFSYLPTLLLWVTAIMFFTINTT